MKVKNYSDHFLGPLKGGSSKILMCENAVVFKHEEFFMPHKNSQKGIMSHGFCLYIFLDVVSTLGLWLTAQLIWNTHRANEQCLIGAGVNVFHPCRVEINTTASEID